jgi:hypothetical protein
MEAYVLAALVRVAVRLWPLKRVAATLASVPRRRGASHESVDACLDAARRAVARVSHPTCFFEALVGFTLLARRGCAVELHVGARRAADLEAHAWLTIDGRPCDPRGSHGYTPVWRVAPAPAR